jgi:hypothetical protein
MHIPTNKDHIITYDSSNISKYKGEKFQRHPWPQMWKEIVHIETCIYSWMTISQEGGSIYAFISCNIKLYFDVLSLFKGK